MLHRDRLWKIANNTKSSSCIEKYSQINKKCSYLLSKFLRIRERNTINKSSSKGLYTLINQKTRVLPKDDILRNKDGKLISSDPEKAELFAKTFLQAHENNVTITAKTVFPQPTVTSSLPYFTKNVIFRALSNCKSSYSETPDFIPGIFIKKLAFELCPPIEIIFNTSLWSGVVPDFWKRAFVVPIPKKTLSLICG